MGNYTNKMPSGIIGEKFGFLTVIGLGPPSKDRRLPRICLCECGNIVQAASNNLISGKTKSCGCKRSELIKKAKTKHGQSLPLTREYRAWTAMKCRVLNKNSKSYRYYGAKGVSICEQWTNSFQQFFDDMGPCPKNLTLDRIDPFGDYTPDNCRWASWKVQRKNRRR